MDGNAPHHTCVSDRIPNYLNGDLADAEMRSIEEHLSNCRDCARALEREAAADEIWLQTRSLLSADDLDGALSLTSDSSDPVELPYAETQAPCDASMLAREIKGWMDPTDDPHSMGRFAGYEIVGVIGHGGMGIVLKGFETALNRFVAIKAMAPRLASSKAARTRFAREAQAAAAVIHENIIAIYRVDEAHGLPFLVMPYWGGESLQRRIDESGPLELETSLRIASQISAGLAAAHQRGLIHRDIKPANILLGRGISRVTITDFGLARAADDASITRTGVIAGTPQYMSPEQAMGKPLDPRSDLFSLGSVLYTMLTGKPPFSGDSNHNIINKVVHRQAQPIGEVRSELPQWTSKLIDRLHHKSAEQRMVSASEFQVLIDACLRHLRDPDSPLPTTLAPKQAQRRRAPVFMGALAVIGLALICAVALPLILTGDQAKVQTKDQTTNESSREGIWSGDQLDREIISIESEIIDLEN